MGVVVEMRDSTEDVAKIIKNNKYRKQKQTLCVIFTILIMFVGTYMFIELQTYSHMRVMQNYGTQGTDNISFKAFADGVLKYSRDGVAFLDVKGKESWNQACQIKTPFVNTSSKMAVLADRGGNDMLVFDSSGLVGEIHTGYPIEQTRISENGIVVAVLKNENTPQIVCYDSVGNVLVEIKSSTAGTGYPIGLAISPNGKTLQVSYLCVEENTEATRNVYYSFAKGKGEDAKTTEEIIKNVLCPISFFCDNKTSIVVKDSSFMIYKGDNEPTLSKTIELEKEISSVFYNEESVGFILKNGGQDESELQVYDFGGNLKFAKNFSGDYKSAKIDGGDVILTSGKRCMIFSSWGVCKYDGETEKDPIEMITLSGINKYLMITGDGMEAVRLVK